MHSWRGDLYVVLGDPLKDGAYSVRLYFNPLVRLIWLGAVAMFIGGGLSLSDRRLRISAPKRAKATRPGPRPRRIEQCRQPALHRIRFASARCFSAALLSLSVSLGNASGESGRARRGAARLGARGESAPNLRRLALPRLPEPVDRRSRQRRSPRISACWCGSGSRLATPTSRSRISSLPAMVNSCCSSPASKLTPFAVVRHSGGLYRRAADRYFGLSAAVCCGAACTVEQGGGAEAQAFA